MENLNAPGVRSLAESAAPTGTPYFSPDFVQQPKFRRVKAGKKLRPADPWQGSPPLKFDPHNTEWLLIASEIASDVSESFAGFQAQLHGLNGEGFLNHRSEMAWIEACKEASKRGPRGVRHARVVAAEGGPTVECESCNTHSLSSHGVAFTGGFDTLELSLSGEWNPSSLKALGVALDEAVEKSRSGELGYLADIEDGSKIPVRPEGCKHGPTYCPWVLTPWPGVQIHISQNASSERSKRANVFIQIGAIAFLTVGGLYWVYEALAVLAKLGYVKESETISRVDGCVDLPNVHVSEFTIPVMSDKYVSRARKGSLHWDGRGANKYTGFTVGIRTRIRIYDKLREVEKDDVKLQLMIQERWGGVLPSCATRVEFQLRNDELREKYDIRTLADLEAKAPALFSTMATKWFRVSDKVVHQKGKHQSRAKASGIWNKVIDAFRSVFAWSSEQVLTKPKKVKPCPRRLSKGFAGYLSSMCARMGIVIDSVEDMFLNANLFLAAEFGNVQLGTQRKSVEFDTQRVGVGMREICNNTVQGECLGF